MTAPAAAAPQLLVSGFGDDTGGGLFAYDGETLEQLDSLSSTGLALAGGRLARLLRNVTDPGFASELLVYDERGVAAYARLDDVADAHDLAWDGSSFVVVSSATNSVLWISRDGEVKRRWAAPGNGDAWHLNGLLQAEGRLLVCAFGRHDDHRAWEEHSQNDGVVFDLETGKDVLNGLAHPHNPRRAGDSWFVCNSGNGELLEIDAGTGRRVRTAQLDGWTRGLAVGEEQLFVGCSAIRGAEGAARASIAVVDRSSFEVLDLIELPCREAYDLLLVPPQLVSGARRGFRTNALREEEGAQLGLFAAVGVRPARLWATGEALPPEACRVRIAAELPSSVRRGVPCELRCRVENRGSAILVPAPPHPVHLGYRLRNGDGTYHEGPRTRLPEALPPGESVECVWSLMVPEPGRYTVELTLVQENVRWFDEVDPGNRYVASVEVT